MCRKAVDDLIDFEVSDTWRDYYFEVGVTPFHSPGYVGCWDRRPSAERVASVEETLEKLVEVMAELVSQRSDERMMGSPRQPGSSAQGARPKTGVVL